MKKLLVSLAVLLLCSAVLPALAEDVAPARPGIDVELWARPTEVAPGQTVFLGGTIRNLSRSPDAVKVCLAVESRYFAQRLGCFSFRLGPGETARFSSRYVVPRLRPGMVLVFTASATSARGAYDKDAVRVMVVPALTR